MSPQVLTQTAPPTQAAPAVQATQDAPKEDLITRASKVSLDTPMKDEPIQTESIKLDQATIDKIADPILKASVQEAYKSMQADYTRKTQDLATKRRELEAKKGYDIPQMLSDPEFVRAAQDYQRINGGQSAPSQGSELSADEFSYLSPEQQKLYTKTKEVEEMNKQIISKLNSSETARVFAEQDTTLRTKYANYEPTKVDEIYQGMMSGTVQATREHLWKVLDYEPAVQRAYKLGLEDRKLQMGEKFAASSQTNGVTVSPASDVPVRMEKESGVEYFKRIALGNAARLLQQNKK